MNDNQLFVSNLVSKLGWLVVILSILSFIIIIFSDHLYPISFITNIALLISGLVSGFLLVIFGQASRSLLEIAYYTKSLSFNMKEPTSEISTNSSDMGFSFIYKDVKVNHDNHTFKVGDNKFNDSSSAKKYIDKLKARKKDFLNR